MTQPRSSDTQPSNRRELSKRAEFFERIVRLVGSTMLAELPADEWRKELKAFLDDPKTVQDYAAGDLQYAREKILAAEDIFAGRALACAEVYSTNRVTTPPRAFRTNVPGLLVAIVVAIVLPIVYWTTEITHRGDAAAYAAWQSYRDQHCAQISVTVVPRTDQVVNVYRCDGYKAWIADKGDVPRELAGKFRSAREAAMCRARAELLPWRPDCLGQGLSP